MSGAEVMIASQIVGSGTSIIGNIQEAKRTEEAAQRNAQLKNMQAQELLERQAINEEIIRNQAHKSGLRYGSGFAARGGQGAGLGGILAMRRTAEQDIMNTRRDAEYRARLLRAGAQIELDLASDAMSAAYLQGFSTLLTGSTRTYNAMRPASSSTQSLPEGQKGMG